MEEALHPSNEPGKSYQIDDRRRSAALVACDGLPTEALERGIVKELYMLAAFIALMNKVADRHNGDLCIPTFMWEENVGAAMNRLNDTVVPGHSARGMQ